MASEIDAIKAHRKTVMDDMKAAQERAAKVAAEYPLGYGANHKGPVKPMTLAPALEWSYWNGRVKAAEAHLEILERFS